MRNALILGSSRSGTSLLAQIAEAAGYHVGTDLLRPDALNERGYLESQIVNWINDTLLLPLMFRPPHWEFHHPWLSIIPSDASPPSIESLGLGADVSKQLAVRPFCLKDPRFSVTYPAWKPYLPDGCVILVAFRHPAAFLRSLGRGRELGQWAWIQDEPQAWLDSWESFYLHILKNDDGRFAYFRFDDLFTEPGLRSVADCLGVAATPTFVVRKNLRHFTAEGESPEVPERLLDLYERLCRRVKCPTVQAAYRAGLGPDNGCRCQVSGSRDCPS